MNENEIYKLSAKQLSTKLNAKELSSAEITKAFLERIENFDNKIGSYLQINSENALKEANEIDSARVRGDKLPKMAGVPISVKDLICTKGIVTTAASKILESWVPPYDATIVENIKKHKMIMLGKVNLDEFAMGSSTERSAYKLCKNPWDLSTVPGGSSGGSASSVAGYFAPFSVGTDTGGSIRQPAAFTGLVGAKPTYGGVSRFGIIAMASSLDQAGPLARDVLDAAILHDILSSYDKRDSTSLDFSFGSMEEAVLKGQKNGVKGKKIGVIKELSGEGFAPKVLSSFRDALDKLSDAGAQIQEISCPNFKYSIGAYQILMASEASSNLERFDGMRFGKRFLPESGNVTAETMMSTTRGKGFGFEVIRRIILGMHSLSAGSYEAHYGAAQKVRTLILQDFENAFKKVDYLVSPTAPTVAFKFGEQLENPMQMYMNDMATIPANFAGCPAISVPSSLAENDLPSGFQIIAPQKSDYSMYELAAGVENLINFEYDKKFSLSRGFESLKS